jgi:Chitin synthase export chaperone
MKVDGSFIATILETASVTAIYQAWKSITEGGAPFSLPPSLIKF